MEYSCLAMNVDSRKTTKLTQTSRPMVSIGLPVHNGEAYLRQALDSILSQTFRQFELVISDNASDDKTETICREYAAVDARIRYHRQTRNRGVTWNFRQVVLLSLAKYFLWTSHDDLMGPNYVERCVTILEHNPSVVLCYSEPMNIDEAGTQFEPGCPLKADLPRPFFLTAIAAYWWNWRYAVTTIGFQSISSSIANTLTGSHTGILAVRSKRVVQTHIVL